MLHVQYKWPIAIVLSTSIPYLFFSLFSFFNFVLTSGINRVHSSNFSTSLQYTDYHNPILRKVWHHDANHIFIVDTKFGAKCCGEVAGIFVCLVVCVGSISNATYLENKRTHYIKFSSSDVTLQLSFNLFLNLEGFNYFCSKKTICLLVRYMV